MEAVGRGKDRPFHSTSESTTILVNIGEVLQDRYESLAKQEYAAYYTVWLARVERSVRLHYNPTS